jgi:alpha-amylase
MRGNLPGFTQLSSTRIGDDIVKRPMNSLILFLLLVGLHSFAAAQSVPITFRVNMKYQVQLGNFNPSNDFVDIAGTFNNWDGQASKLTDANADSIYEIVIGGFVPATTIQFKFRINGLWTGLEEFPGGGPNRVYTVQPDSNDILVWYNDQASPDGALAADFTADVQTLLQRGAVHFQDRSAGAVIGRHWIFEGGSPDTSSASSPYVYYPNPGTFDVTLIVSDSTGADTLHQPGYITVGVRDTSKTYWWNNTVFYEMFVRSFYDSNGDGIGDFSGIVQKLDYLQDLGVSGIWLMPINPSPSYHGYDVTDYRAVNSQYGTMNDFTLFLSEAHKRGIRVIIDLVLNHSSSQHPWFQLSASGDQFYRGFYRWSATNPGYLGPWGQQVWYPYGSSYYYALFWSGMPDLNYETQAVKDSMFAAADYWLSTVGVDGFRLDAAMYIFEDGNLLVNAPKTFQFWSDFTTHIKQAKPDALSVGEAWTNTDQVLAYVTNNRLDYCFEFDLAGATLAAVNAGDARQLAAQMQKVYDVYPHLQYGTFLTNHDQNRSMSEFGSNPGKAKAAAALYLTFPGIPYLYYGEEIGMTGVKPDEDIRTPMQWSTASNAGFTSGSPWRNVNANYAAWNVATELADSASLLLWYKKLIALRNGESALRLGEYEGLTSSSNAVMAFMRHYGGRWILVVVNTGGSAQDNVTLTLQGNGVQPETYGSTDLLTGSPGPSISVGPDRTISVLSVSPYGVMLLAFEDGTSSAGGTSHTTAAAFSLEQNFPNPFNPSTTIRYAIPYRTQVKLAVYDVLGREVAVLANGEQGAGTRTVRLDGSDLASGVYFYRLQAGTYVRTSKMLLLK